MLALPISRRTQRPLRPQRTILWAFQASSLCVLCGLCVLSSSSWEWSPRLRDDVDERRLAALDTIERALDRGRQVFRVLDRSLAEHAVGLRHFRVVDVRLAQRRADVGEPNIDYAKMAQAYGMF